MPYRAECECGFKGEIRGSWAVAEVDKDRHNFRPKGVDVPWQEYHQAKVKTLRHDGTVVGS